MFLATSELLGVERGSALSLTTACYDILARMSDTASGGNEAGRRGDAEPGVPGLAPKLEHLFAAVPRPDGGRYTNESAAQALGEAGIRVSSVHLSHLRSGRRSNPSARLLAGLAELFGVPIAYFFDAAIEEQVNDELSTLIALHDTRVKGLMLRAQGLNRQNFQKLERVLEQIRRDQEQAGEEGQP
jgi:transcriptional regulator with XRE-family HTH domain